MLYFTVKSKAILVKIYVSHVITFLKELSPLYDETPISLEILYVFCNVSIVIKLEADFKIWLTIVGRWQDFFLCLYYHNTDCFTDDGRVLGRNWEKYTWTRSPLFTLHWNQRSLQRLAKRYYERTISFYNQSQFLEIWIG